MRINRFLSQAGLGSRRHVEAFVTQGRVTINGARCTDLSARVERTDVVEVDGRRVESVPGGRVWLFHKPAGVVTSFHRQGSDPCLDDVLDSELRSGRLFHVGRLDKDSSGLLLLSDDGDLAHRLLHPSHPVWKRYEGRIDVALDEEDLRDFAGGVLELDGRPCAPARIEVGEGTAYRVELREGRRRQIRRMLELLGRQVESLVRTRFGPLSLDDLAPGGWREASSDEVGALREAGGLPPR